VLCFASSFAAAQKSICTPLKSNTSQIIDPSKIPASFIGNLSNRGVGSYSAAINVCTPGALAGCAATKGFVGVSNASGCTVYDRALQRPELIAHHVIGNFSLAGFKVSYADAGKNGTTKARDLVELVVMCHNVGGPTSGALWSRSGKFFRRENKHGGSTTMLLTYSNACHQNVRPHTTRPHHHASSHAPHHSSHAPHHGNHTRVPHHHHSSAAPLEF
jgi:hypothetical protein